MTHAAQYSQRQFALARPQYFPAPPAPGSVPLQLLRTSPDASIPSGMADDIVVGMYDSIHDAEAARARLLAQGLREEQISIEAGAAAGEAPMTPGDRFAMHEVGEPLPEERGVSGFIARMFSGALMGDANVGKYTEALRNGRCLLAVRAESDAQRKVAAATVARGGPRIYSLPNAPTAWNEASANDPASIGGVDRDPARPEGLLTDVEGLSAHADVTRLSNSPRVRRNR
jgi:hypothetical protein